MIPHSHANLYHYSAVRATCKAVNTALLAAAVPALMVVRCTCRLPLTSCVRQFGPANDGAGRCVAATSPDAGLIPRAVHGIFEAVIEHDKAQERKADEASRSEMYVKCSFLQVPCYAVCCTLMLCAVLCAVVVLLYMRCSAVCGVVP